jgi:hypothetical protein
MARKFEIFDKYLNAPKALGTTLTMKRVFGRLWALT